MRRCFRLGARNEWSMLARDGKAAGALEYAILCSFLVLAIIAGATVFGKQLGQVYENLAPVVKGFPT